MKLFKEKQVFNQLWLWLILVPVAFLPVIGVYKQLFLGVPFGNNPMSNTLLLILTTLIFSVIALFLIMYLKTDIDKYGIYIRFFPFVKKEVKWKDVKKARVVNYGFVGGWGIRFWTKYGTIYNTSGNKGLAIELKDGKKFLIGTQKVDELRETIEKIYPNKSDNFESRH